MNMTAIKSVESWIIGSIGIRLRIPWVTLESLLSHIADLERSFRTSS